MSSAQILGDKDTNAPIEQFQPSDKGIKSMEYHRQVFQSKVQEP